MLPVAEVEQGLGPLRKNPLPPDVGAPGERDNVARHVHYHRARPRGLERKIATIGLLDFRDPPLAILAGIGIDAEVRTHLACAASDAYSPFVRGMLSCG